MSRPGFAPPDLCSIRATAEHEEHAEAARGGFSADRYTLSDDDPPAPLTSRIGVSRAGQIAQAFRPPLCFAQVHMAGFYDDAGFCQDCELSYGLPGAIDHPGS